MKVKSCQHILKTTKKNFKKFKKNDGYYSVLIVTITFYEKDFFKSFLNLYKEINNVKKL